MLCFNLTSTDPGHNLAVEELLLRKYTYDCLLIYVNSQSVIIGKHQVAHREADTEFVTMHKIPVIRRISGGGTVFHDPGNLNFTFLLQSKPGNQVDFRKYTRPVIDFLATLGIEAKFEGKNDLKVNGLKISGNAEHIFRERVLHHGTVLFDSDLELMKKTIRSNTSCYFSRGVMSNPSPVMNLKVLLPDIKTAEDFRQKMYCYFINSPGNTGSEIISDMVSGAESLAESKFRKWEWNYAYGPEYQFNNSFVINGKKHTCRLSVRNGIIKECETGGSPEMVKVSGKLIGCRHMPEDIFQLISQEKITYNFNDVIKLFF